MLAAADKCAFCRRFAHKPTTTRRPASNPRFARGAARYDSQASEDRPRRDLRQRCGRRGRRLHHQPRDFLPEVLAQHKAKYADAKPYTHGVVTPLCDDARLRAVQAEMREHLTANFKETDLFKVLQTGDLVTIDKADPSIVPKIPELLKLRAAIYSPQFRAMVQEMTGCAPLTDRIDCSANVYPRSGHLLCHDDAIGTRCIRTSSSHRPGRGVDRTRRRRARTVPRHRARDSRGGPHHRAAARVEQHGVLHRATRQKLPLGPRGLRGGQAATEHQRLVPRRGGA